VLQSAGRPDITAKLHMIELPLYLPALWWLITDFGIQGAAMAWVFRIALDMVLLFILSIRIMPEFREARSAILSAAVCLITGALVLFPEGPVGKTAGVSLALLIFSFWAWFLVINIDERLAISKRIRFMLFANIT
jgi:O-antigen/teichoic acid export membrane protein